MAFIRWDLAYKKQVEGSAKREDKASFLAHRLKEEFSNLGFLNFEHVEKLEKDLARVGPRIEKYKNMLVLGIGGSALGAKALQRAFYPEQDFPLHQGKSLYILDNIHPELIKGYLDRLSPEKTVVVVISKSGTTIETLSQYFWVKKWLAQQVKNYKEHLVIITDPRQGFLRAEVEKEGFLSLEVPPRMGGRYSVLSAVGLLPAYFLGIDWKSLLLGAKSLVPGENLKDHPAFKLALWAHELWTQGLTELIYFNYIPFWDCWGDWFAQLWAESLGKAGKGSMPIPSVGVTDQHSLLQMFLDGPKNKGCIFLKTRELPPDPYFSFALPQEFSFLEQKSFGDIFQAEALGTEMALARKMPLVEIELDRRTELEAGKLILLLELTTLFTGWLLDLNPLDQPAVELGKRLAKAKLGAPGLEEEKKELAIFLQKDNKLEEF